LPVSWLDRQPPEVSKWQLTKRAALTESLRKLSQTCVDAELRSLAPGGPHRWRGAIPPSYIGYSRALGFAASQPEGGEFSQGKKLAPRAGFEPATLRLTAECSTIELPRNDLTQALSLEQTLSCAVNFCGASMPISCGSPIVKPWQRLKDPLELSGYNLADFLSGSDFAKPDGQPAFIARRRVLLNDAPLCRAIDQRISLGNQLRRSLDILGFQQAPHGPDAMTQTGLASAVDQGTAFGHAHAFERRYSICHSNFKNTVIGPAGSNRRDPVPATRRPAAARLQQLSFGVPKITALLQVQ
jgi:hypothetical protein